MPDVARRLQALRDLGLLEHAGGGFDRVTRLASRLFDAPIALITLIDAERQWFKSRVGTDLTDVGLTHAFCTHTIRQDGILVVEDARRDKRFAGSPFVTGPTAIRFYAGVPLATPDGTRVGTLCVLDLVARGFDATQSHLMRDLAAIVEEEIANIEKEQASRRQRDSEAWMRAILEHIPDGVLMLDEQGIILSMNPAAERIYRSPGGALVGHAAQELLQAEDLKRIMALAPLSNLTPYEGTGVRKDGSRFALEFTVNRLGLDGRNLIAAVVRDVSERHEAEQRSRAVEERRRRHFATATHELRTPMASVLGFSELLLKREFDSATGKELVGIIHRQTNRLVALINQLLDLARIEAGGRDGLDLQALTVRDLVDQTLAGLVGLGETHRIDVRLENGLPPLVGDPAKLQQALTNLLGNSIKYSAPGTPIVLSSGTELCGGRSMVTIRVRDHGIGMTPEQQAQIFDAFYRADNVSTTPGSGLGMTIFKEIMDVHGGSVDVHSTPGAGTEIAMRLPAANEGPGLG